MELPDTYRGRYRDLETAGEKYGAEAETLVENIMSRGAKVRLIFILDIFWNIGDLLILKTANSGNLGSDQKSGQPSWYYRLLGLSENLQ